MHNRGYLAYGTINWYSYLLEYDKYICLNYLYASPSYADGAKITIRESKNAWRMTKKQERYTTSEGLRERIKRLQKYQGDYDF